MLLFLYVYKLQIIPSVTRKRQNMTRRAKLKRFCNETESNQVVYPYREQYCAAGSNRSINADGGNGKRKNIRKDL